MSDSERSEKTPARTTLDVHLIEKKLQRAGREAIRQHALAGRSVPVAEDGKIVWLTPDEIFARIGRSEPE